MWGSFHSRERILKDSTAPIWPYAKIIKNMCITKKKEREKKDCTGVPYKADSSIVADVFSSPIIKLQRP